MQDWGKGVKISRFYGLLYFSVIVVFFCVSGFIVLIYPFSLSAPIANDGHQRIYSDRLNFCLLRRLAVFDFRLVLGSSLFSAFCFLFFGPSHFSVFFSPPGNSTISSFQQQRIYRERRATENQLTTASISGTGYGRGGGEGVWEGRRC